MPMESISVISLWLLFGYVYIILKVYSLLFHEISSHFKK